MIVASGSRRRRPRPRRRLHRRRYARLAGTSRPRRERDDRARPRHDAHLRPTPARSRRPHLERDGAHRPDRGDATPTDGRETGRSRRVGHGRRDREGPGQARAAIASGPLITPGQHRATDLRQRWTPAPLTERPTAPRRTDRHPARRTSRRPAPFRRRGGAMRTEGEAATAMIAMDARGGGSTRSPAPAAVRRPRAAVWRGLRPRAARASSGEVARPAEALGVQQRPEAPGRRSWPQVGTVRSRSAAAFGVRYGGREVPPARISLAHPARYTQPQ
jgi:hypothetical protein